MESGKIIVVANQKGGVAKTSTVRNLSYALAEMGKKVLVVDFDLWKNGEHDLDKIAQTTELSLEQVREAITEPCSA